jgi:hypothetical protein
LNGGARRHARTHQNFCRFYFSNRGRDKLDFTFYEVPTRQTVMHRIIQGPDKNMWFTELKPDRFGRVDMKAASKMK